MVIKSHSILRAALLSPALLAATFHHGSLASAASPFTIAVIGDQQSAVKSTTYYPSFTVQTDWLAANASATNLRFVTQVGDIIENGNSIVQWNRAEAAMVTLDTATNADGGTGVPWNVSYGNHEQDSSQPGTDPAGAWAHLYRQYFGSASGTHRYAGQPEYGSVSSNDLNTWHIIKSSNAVDAREYLMLNLEYDVPGHTPGSTPDPSDVPAFDAIAWAQNIIDLHPGIPTIVTTHIFGGGPFTSGPGRNSQLEIWNKLVKDNAQIFMVLSGHSSSETHGVNNNTAGLPVLQMVTDYAKWLPNGGDGYMRLVELDEDGGEIRVKTYTPGIPSYNPPTPPGYRTNANGEFTVAMDWSTRFPTISGPLMGAPTVVATTNDGATVQCLLANDDADDVTLVWAFTDQGTTAVGDWTSASGGGSHSFGATTQDSVLNRALTGLNGDQQYVFRYLATTTAESDWSSAGTFVTGIGGLAAPSGFNGTASAVPGGTKVDLTWTDGFTNETGFVIRRSTDPGFATFDEFAIGPNETEYSDKTTTANTTYYFRIAGVGTAGTGTFTNNLEVTTGDPGGAPVAGLIGHWQFDDGSGTTADDASDYGNDATTSGGSWVTGEAGGAYDNPRFTLADSSDLNLTGSVPFSISLWVKPNAAHGFTCLAGFEGTGSTGDIYAFKTDGADKLQLTPSGTTTPDTLMNYSNSGVNWVHVVGVHEPGVGSRIYIDGTEVATGSAGSIPTRTEIHFTMGTYWNSANNFNGALDDVQVYSAAISPADVAYLNSNPGSPLLEGGGIGPVMGSPSSNSPTDDGSTLECQLLNADADAVTLVWAEADQGESDLSSWTSASGGGSHSFGATTANNVLSHAVSGLGGDTEYFFRFLATAGGDSDWSEVGSFATGLGGAAAPADLVAVAGTTATTTKVDLTWTDSYATETGFVIQRSTNSGFSSYDEFNAGANATALTDDTTSPNTTYFYRIAAVGSAGAGTFSSGVEVVTSDAPSVAPQVLRGPYLQAAGPDRITIRWRTDIAGVGVVRYGTAPGVLSQSTSPGTAETEHIVPITGLTPNTVYYYEIETQNGTASTTIGDDADHFFKTHPTPGTSEPGRIWVIGDSGTTTTAKQDVYDAYRNRGEDTDVWLMLGDNAYNSGTDAEFQAAVFDSYPELLRNTPLWSCIGNHEAYTSAGQPYLDLHTFPTAGESGGVASGSERYYSFDHGNIHFVCIDSQTAGNYNDTPGGGGMVDWLELDLQATDKDWIIAYMHHGPYTKGSHDSDTESHHIVIRRYVVPLLEQYGVDLVLSGHSHCYERSMLINGHHSAMSTADSTSSTFNPATHVVDSGNGSAVGSVDGTGTFVTDGGDGVYNKLDAVGDVGTVYSTCGASGKLSAWDNGSTAIVNPDPHPVFIVNLRVMGSMIIDVDGSTLHARYIDGSNVVRDDFTIEKAGSGPFLGSTSVTAVTDDGATVECQLLNAAADQATLVWAFADQGTNSVADWTSAPGGGSHSFGSAVQDEVLSRLLTGLDGDSFYSFRFFASAGPDSDWSAEGTFATGLGGSSAPGGLSAVAGTTVSTTKVDLSWTESFTTETGFLIQRSTDSGFSSFDEFNADAGAASFTDDTTSPNTTYFYRIAAVGSTGAGTFSSGVEVTTGDEPTGGPVAALVGHWKLDDGSGSTAADSSVNGYDATSNGAGSWITGKAGSAYNLPRFSLDAPDSASVSLAGGGAVTLSTWVTDRTGGGFEGIAGFENTGTDKDIYSLKMDDGDKINWTVLPSHGPILSADTLANYAAATGDGWVHVVGVFEQGVGSTLYVNGAVAASTSSAADAIATKTSIFGIGSYQGGGSYAFSGSVDDVQVYNEALSLTDVSFLYNNPGSPIGSTPPSSPFNGWATTNITNIDAGADATFEGNPDGDPFGNGLEWALGGNPLGFDSLGDLLGFSGDATTGLTFTFTREDASEGEVDLAIESSTDLFDTDNNSSLVPAGSGTVGGVNYTILENESAPDSVTATIPAALGGKLFGRVRATQE